MRSKLGSPTSGSRASTQNWRATGSMELIRRGVKTFQQPPMNGMWRQVLEEQNARRDVDLADEDFQDVPYPGWKVSRL